MRAVLILYFHFRCITDVSVAVYYLLYATSLTDFVRWSFRKVASSDLTLKTKSYKDDCFLNDSVML